MGHHEPDEKVTRREADLRWDNHFDKHKVLDKSIETTKITSATALRIALEDHHREHLVHEASHEREHEFTKEALDKADESLEKRLESMNEFRAQLQGQAATFLSKEAFEQYSKEQLNKTETALQSSGDKYDALIAALVNRHDADTDAIRTELQQEREYRKLFEGSINTWKWIASFLGISGVAGVIMLFLTRGSG